VGVKLDLGTATPNPRHDPKAGSVATTGLGRGQRKKKGGETKKKRPAPSPHAQSFVCLLFFYLWRRSINREYQRNVKLKRKGTEGRPESVHNIWNGSKPLQPLTINLCGMLGERRAK
jgi:hypothetical protein